MSWLKHVFDLQRVLGLQWILDLQWFDDHSECGLGCARAAMDLSVHG